MTMAEPLREAVSDSLGDDPALPLDAITVTVRGAAVELGGTVAWRYQRERIEYLVERVEGVRVVRNAIEVTATGETNLALAAGIGEVASARGGDRDVGDSVRVEIDGAGTLTLFGDVHSDDSYRAALAAAWAVPGVQNVRDRLA